MEMKAGIIGGAMAMLAGLTLLGCRSPAPAASETQNGPPPEEAQELVSEAASAIQGGEFTRARDRLREAIKLHPRFAEAWTSLGMASVKLGDTRQARKAYERALGLYEQRYRDDPSEASPLRQQIYLLVLLGREEEAAKRLTTARQNHPEDSQVQLLTDLFPGAAVEWKEYAVPAE